ncbi:MAG: Ig-like domain-containing protein, partial [Syntrophomonas sp.]
MNFKMRYWVIPFVLAFIFCLFFLSPAKASGADDIANIANEISAVYPYIDNDYKYVGDGNKTDLDYIADARNALGSLDASDPRWDSVVNPLVTNQVKGKFLNENAAKAALIDFIKDLGDLYYTTDSATLETRLTSFKNDATHKDTFQKLFGSDVEIVNLYNLIIDTRKKYPDVVFSSDIEDLAWESNDIMVSKMTDLTKKAMQAAIAGGALDGKLEPLGWSIDTLINQKTTLAGIIDPDNKAQLALARAAVRCKAEFYKSTGEKLTKNSNDKMVHLSLQTTDSAQGYRLKIMNQAATTMVEWVSSNSSVASLDQTELNSTGYPVLTPRSAGTTTVTAYRHHDTTYNEGTAAKDWILKVLVTVSQGSSDPGTNPQPQPQLTSIELSGSLPSPFRVGDTFQLSSLTVSGKDQNGQAYDISALSKTWSSSNSTVAAINGAQLEAKGAGTATVTVTVGGKQSNALMVEVVAGELKTVELSGTVPSPFRVGDTFQLSSLTVSGKDQNGQAYDISTMSKTWSSSNSAVAAINGAQLEAKGAGTADITVTVGGKQSNALTVEVVAGELKTVELSGTVPSPFRVGDTFQLSSLTVTGKDQNGQAYDKSTMSKSWSSSNSAVAVINGAQLEAKGAGMADITVTVGGKQSNALAVEVVAGELKTVELTGTVPSPFRVGDTFQL